MIGTATLTCSEQATRERITRLAEGCLLSQGYSKVTMAEIAAELGMSKKTIYQHFPTKEDLFLSVIEGFFGEIRVDFDTILADDQLPFTDKVRRVLLTMGGRVGRLQAHALQDVKRTMPRGWHRIQELRREIILTRLGGLIRAGIESGQIRPDLNQTLLVRMLLALIEQIGTPETLAQTAASPADAFHMITSVFFEGILTDTARRDVTR